MTCRPLSICSLPLSVSLLLAVSLLLVSNKKGAQEQDFSKLFVIMSSEMNNTCSINSLKNRLFCCFFFCYERKNLELLANSLCFFSSSRQWLCLDFIVPIAHQTNIGASYNQCSSLTVIVAWTVLNELNSQQ